MSNWTLVYEKFDPQKEKLREALCTLGNGYLLPGGAGPEAAADDIHYPGIYLAGGYERASTEIAGRVIENEDLVNLSNWLAVNFRLADSINSSQRLSGIVAKHKSDKISARISQKR